MGSMPVCRVRRTMWSVWSLVALGAASLVAVSTPADTGGAVSGYVSLPTSARLVDTRPGAPTIDGQFAGIGLQPAGSTLDVTVGGRAGVPLDAPVVVLTVTAVDSQGSTSPGWQDGGFLTVHATGTPRPNASNLNYYPYHNTAGTVFARVGADGKVSIYTLFATQLVVDVAGYLPAGSYSPLPTPARLVDTRPGTSTIDGQFVGIGSRPGGSTLDVPVAGRAGIPVDAAVAVLTVTATFEWGPGFLTVHPTGTPRPNASNLNFYYGHDIANTVVVPVGADGKVSIYTSTTTDLVVDVSGHLPTGTYTALPNAARLADTRPGGTTVDGQQAGIGRIAGGANLQLSVAGRAGVPTDASVAVLTVVAVDSLRTGFSTVFPTGAPRPNASNLNYNPPDARDLVPFAGAPGHNTANTVVARIGAGGDVCVFASGATHFVVDVSGYFSGPAPAAAGPACPEPAPVFAIWPASNVVFDTPEEAAADFISKWFGVEPHLGAFQPGDARSGAIEVLHPGDDVDPTTFFPSGTTLSLRQLPPDFGWFVIGAGSTEVTITTPAAGATVVAGPVTVEGVAVGHERTTYAEAFVAGDATSLDFEMTMAGLFAPEPYSMTLDLAGASSGDVVGLIVQGDSGLHALAGQFAAIPVLVGS